MKKVTFKHNLVRLFLALCLCIGWIAQVPLRLESQTIWVDEADPDPDAPSIFPGDPTGDGKTEVGEDFLMPDKEQSRFGTPGSEKDKKLLADLLRLEKAMQQGPEAVIALLGQLQGKALDLAMEEINQDMEELGEGLAPAQWSEPRVRETLSPEEQLIYQAENRARALADPDDPNELLGLSPAPIPQANRPDAPFPSVGPGCNYAFITNALAAVSAGTTIYIAGGVTFAENLEIDKDITLEGGYPGCSSGSTARSTIDGGGSGRVIEIYSNLEVTLLNLNITNGNEDWGGGIRVNENSDLMGDNLQIYNNTATFYGGGMRVWGARVVLTDSDIDDNTAPLGAGIYATESGDYAPSIDLQSYADVTYNQALTGSGFGGGVYLREGEILIGGGSDLMYNDALYGGGAYLVNSTLTIEGSLSEIQDNDAAWDGGGVYAQGSWINLDNRAEIRTNLAGSSGTAGFGGGVYLDDSDLYSDGASILDNLTYDSGGGVYATNGSRLDMDLGVYPCSVPRCSQLSENDAGYDSGGGVFAFQSVVDLVQTFVEDNEALEYAAGIYAYDSSINLNNVLMAGNQDYYGGGDGLTLYRSLLFGEHNTLAYNPSDGTGTAILIDESPSTIELSNLIIWGHATSISEVGHSVTCSDIQGGYTGTDNRNEDPQFVDPSSNNFHLPSDSPVLDRCDSGLADDFEDEPRPQTYLRPATPYDMGADEAGPRVGINEAGCSYGRIQDAVDAAVSGDSIQVSAGTYQEQVDIVSEDLTITGEYDDTCTAPGGGLTMVDGHTLSGTVFEISDSQVTLSELQVLGGNGTVTGGGIELSSGSEVLLDDVDVYWNEASFGGGVYLNAGTVMTATHDSAIAENIADFRGGGVRVWGSFTATTDSYVDDNRALDGGGIAVEQGSVTLDSADVVYNRVSTTEGRGGGIYAADGSSVQITNSSSVSNNEAHDGGGVYADNSSVYVAIGFFYANIASHDGGGLSLTNSALFEGGSFRIGGEDAILGNTAEFGAGLHAMTSTVDLAGGQVYGNLAYYGGGGMYAENSTINLEQVNIGTTIGSGSNQVSVDGMHGGGMLLSNGTTATLSNTMVTGNILQGIDLAHGAGIYAAQNSTVLLESNSKVDYNTIPAAAIGRGGGIFTFNSVVTVDNSQVVSNTAREGGGFYTNNASVLNLQNNAIVSYNEADANYGGGIASTGHNDLNLSDTTMQSNWAGTDGGAIYVDSGTLDLTGWWDLRWNLARGNGGGVAITGTADADFAVTSGTNTSFLGINYAFSHGGGLYIHNTDTVELHAISGSNLNFNTNQAILDGGGAYLDGGGTLELLGRVDATSNHAGRYGGVFYLDNSSNLQLTASGADRPVVGANKADHGGGVYATAASYVACDGAIFGSSLGSGNQAESGSGGAISLNLSSLEAFNCIFRNNQATFHGGAIAAFDSAMIIDADYGDCDPLSEPCSSFYSNTADSDGDGNGYGGAIYNYNGDFYLGKTIMYDNQAHLGGAIYQTDVDGSSGDVENSLFYRNTSNGGNGSGIRVYRGDFAAEHITLVNNSGGDAFASESSAVEIFNSILWGNTGGGFGGTLPIFGCNIDQDGTIGEDRDPSFVDPGAGDDYHLLMGSYAIDKCPFGLPIDLDGVSRPVNAMYDMGVFESPAYVFLPLIVK